MKEEVTGEPTEPADIPSEVTVEPTEPADVTSANVEIPEPVVRLLFYPV